MRVAATTEAIELVRAAGGRVYVWPTRTVGCQPLTFLEAASEPPGGETFHRASFEAFELYLAADARWPSELHLDVSRGRVRALWDGAAWRLPH